MLVKKIFGVVLVGAALTASSAALADRAFNTAAGAVIGAAIGSQTGNGTTGTVVGGVVGGVVGNALSSSDRDRHDRHDHDYRPRGQVYAHPQPVYYEAPRPRYVRQAPVYVERRVVREVHYVDHRGRGHGKGHKKHHRHHHDD